MLALCVALCNAQCMPTTNAEILRQFTTLELSSLTRIGEVCDYAARQDITVQEAVRRLVNAALSHGLDK